MYLSVRIYIYIYVHNSYFVILYPFQTKDPDLPPGSHLQPSCLAFSGSVTQGKCLGQFTLPSVR